MASQMCMNETAPEAILPAPFAGVPRGLKRREIHSDAAALLHCERAFLQGAENARNRIFDRAHDEAIEQRHVACRSGAGLDATAGKELEVLQDAEELLLPRRCVLRLDGSQRTGDAAPSIRDGALDIAAIGVPILRFPDVMGNIGCKSRS